ncbi:hypothetical protein HOT99_gp187 [Caulobacter phage CcrBL10]|uniref:Uncharacterized protein n=1 Tax=Caulobacter phage CcrBL10 TaxID=2283269 RepID=A0A385E9S4_9CAUD|nr:hypothetical protein HOT99_gp187 [Caulobacter phage CcrBL10]AXQ68430.1 hypothetical protein CcrBL10_gp226 [Caulobacter phage CcrBL10]
MSNRVWIELEKPKTAEEGKARAALLCKMLGRLGVEFGRYPAVFWSERDGNYAFTLDGGGSYAVCEGADPGHWYNLDYIVEGLEA